MAKQIARAATERVEGLLRRDWDIVEEAGNTNRPHATTGDGQGCKRRAFDYIIEDCMSFQSTFSDLRE